MKKQNRENEIIEAEKAAKELQKNISELMVSSFNVEKLYYSLSKINSIRL